MKKKMLSIILAAAMTAAMLAGCGKSQGNSAETGSAPAGTEAAGESADQGEVIELTMWGGWGGD